MAIRELLDSGVGSWRQNRADLPAALYRQLAKTRIRTKERLADVEGNCLQRLLCSRYRTTDDQHAILRNPGLPTMLYTVRSAFGQPTTQIGVIP